MLGSGRFNIRQRFLPDGCNLLDMGSASQIEAHLEVEIAFEPVYLSWCPAESPGASVRDSVERSGDSQ